MEGLSSACKAFIFSSHSFADRQALITYIDEIIASGRIGDRFEDAVRVKIFAENGLDDLLFEWFFCEASPKHVCDAAARIFNPPAENYIASALLKLV